MNLIWSSKDHIIHSSNKALFVGVPFSGFSVSVDFSVEGISNHRIKMLQVLALVFSFYVSTIPIVRYKYPHSGGEGIKAVETEEEKEAIAISVSFFGK